MGDEVALCPRLLNLAKAHSAPPDPLTADAGRILTRATAPRRVSLLVDPAPSPQERPSSTTGPSRQGMAYHHYAGDDEGSVWQPLPSQFLPAPPTSLAFDPMSPLLFAGTPSGTVASYFCQPTTGLGGRYTSYRGHWGAVGEMGVDQSGVLSVGGGGAMPGRSGGGGSVKLANRRGMTLWSVEYGPPPLFLVFGRGLAVHLGS